MDLFTLVKCKQLLSAQIPIVLLGTIIINLIKIQNLFISAANDDAYCDDVTVGNRIFLDLAAYFTFTQRNHSNQLLSLSKILLLRGSV